jgi:hypothetical protein
MLDVVEPGFLQELPLPPRHAEKGLVDIFKDVVGADYEEGEGMKRHVNNRTDSRSHTEYTSDSASRT